MNINTDSTDPSDSWCSGHSYHTIQPLFTQS